MTNNSKKVLGYLKDNAGTEYTIREIAEALGFEKSSAVTGSITSFVKKGFADRKVMETETVVTDKDGNEKVKITEVKKFTITEAGLAFDPDAVEE